MTKTLKEIAELIDMLKSKKVKEFSLDTLSITFSDLAFLEEATPGMKEITDYEKKILVDTEETSEDEEKELLYWSTK